MELDSLEPLLHHARHGIAAATAHTDHFDPRAVADLILDFVFEIIHTGVDQSHGHSFQALSPQHSAFSRLSADCSWLKAIAVLCPTNRPLLFRRRPSPSTWPSTWPGPQPWP